MMPKKKLLIVINVDWLFLLHRLPIAQEALSNGWQVIVATRDTGKAEVIKEYGFEFVNLEISRSGTNPIKELRTFFAMFFLYKNMRPDVVYQVTMKPVIYGTVVSRLLNISTLNAISGLGYNFTSERQSKVQGLMIKMLRFGFNKKKNSLIFENKEDCQEFKDLGIINHKNDVNIIKGIGVDLNKFLPVKSNNTAHLIVLLPTRMLWDKGVKEFIEAALLLKQNYIDKVKFVLCGRLDHDNKEAVPKEYLLKKQIEGYIEWIGNQDDMVYQYQNADIVVLPSYREGLPVVLMEACAMGRPIITTTAIGCKDCIDEGVNGYKVAVKDSVALAEAIQKLIDAPQNRIKMGEKARAKAEKEFDNKKVVQLHMDLYQKLL